ncbi:porin [Burkholderia sp. PU8-34]
MKLQRGMARVACFATSIAGLGTVAHAQSSLTIYGITDASILYSSHSTGTKAKQFSFADGGWSPDIFGLKGSEDLGGGLKAQFDLQSGIGLGTGAFKFSNGGMFGRQAWVGVSSNNIGTVKAGLQFSPFFQSISGTDPRGFAQFASGLIAYADNIGQTGVFSSNTVSYTSPSIAGVQVSGAYALGGVAGEFANGRQYSGRLLYDMNGLQINAAFLKSEGGNNPSVPAATNLPVWGRMVGASYTIGSLTMRAAFMSFKRGNQHVLGNTNVYGAGGWYYLTPFWLANAGVWFSRDQNNGANHSILAGVGMQYLLSKRTSLYTQVGWVRNHGVMGTGLAVSGTNNIAGLPAGTAEAVNIGIKHTF